MQQGVAVYLKSVAVPINGTTHTFEHLRKFLPASAKIIDRLEIDTPEDLRDTEKFLKTVDWF